MSDPQHNDPRSPSAEPDDDEPIIELVEEITDTSARSALSPLERKLLGLEDDVTPPPPETSDDLPELELMGFEEENDDPSHAAAPAGAPAAEDGSLPAVDDLDWLMVDDADPPAEAESATPNGPKTRITEILDFDEQFVDAEDILEGTPADSAETSPEDIDDTIELFEIEEEGDDDEIVWFDDLDKEIVALDSETPSAPAVEIPDEPAEEPVAATSAADVFDAHLESAAPFSEEEAAAEAFAPAASASAATLAGLAAASMASPQEAPPPPEPEIPPGAPPFSAADIEAAVERVIERRFGGTIESIIRQAIEAAVTREIDRLKQLLLEDEPGERD